MKRYGHRYIGLLTMLSIILSGTVAFATNMTIVGAGASFPFPVYSQWAHKYYAATKVRLNYQSIGSGGGIAQIKAGTVNFGASDAPLKAGELEECGLIQFPMIMGGVVPVVNVQGLKGGELKLSAPVLADIFLGKVAKWNDPALTTLNPNLSLPDQDINVVHRADGSGTTWIFTNYLDKVSEEWRASIGVGKAVEWPTGVGGKGNEGVSQYVKKVKGSIGYVEFAYALQNHMAHALLENKAGQFVSPTSDSFQSAAAHADWKNAPGFYMVLTDQPGEESWPITGASFILLHKEQEEAEQARAMLKFFAWCYQEGNQIAEELHYVPIPENVTAQVEALWRSSVNVGGNAVWQ